MSFLQYPTPRWSVRVGGVDQNAVSWAPTSRANSLARHVGPHAVTHAYIHTSPNAHTQAGRHAHAPTTVAPWPLSDSDQHRYTPLHSDDSDAGVLKPSSLLQTKAQGILTEAHLTFLPLIMQLIFCEDEINIRANQS